MRSKINRPKTTTLAKFITQIQPKTTETLINISTTPISKN
uniref:Uncharacterized protein n=1 Tax=Rhizophora mucronata TaxID=61149 RepID=A0A2P2NUK6_RHIMU